MRSYTIKINEHQRRLNAAYLRHVLLTAVGDEDLPNQRELEELTRKFEALPYLKNGNTIHDLTARKPKEPG